MDHVFCFEELPAEYICYFHKGRNSEDMQRLRALLQDKELDIVSYNEGTGRYDVQVVDGEEGHEQFMWVEVPAWCLKCSTNEWMRENFGLSFITRKLMWEQFAQYMQDGPFAQVDPWDVHCWVKKQGVGSAKCQLQTLMPHMPLQYKEFIMIPMHVVRHINRVLNELDGKTLRELKCLYKDHIRSPGNCFKVASVMHLIDPQMLIFVGSLGYKLARGPVFWEYGNGKATFLK